MQRQSELPDAKIKLNNKRMSELIYEQISDWIMDGTLEAGQRISEDELADRFGVSRMPVREAVRMLCAKGLMQSIPYVGSTVRKLSNDEIREVYLLRSVLEPLAGRISADNITPAELSQLHALQEKLEEYGQKPISLENSKHMYQMNREFHMSMYRPCRMDRLMQMIDSLWDSIAYLRMRTAFNPKYPEQMQEEHRRYISLLENHKGAELAQHLEDNLRRHVGSFPANGSN